VKTDYKGNWRLCGKSNRPSPKRRQISQISNRNRQNHLTSNCLITLALASLPNNSNRIHKAFPSIIHRPEFASNPLTLNLPIQAQKFLENQEPYKASYSDHLCQEFSLI